MAKKKKKRGGGGARGIDPNERRRERLEARRRAKAEAEKRQQQRRRRERLVRALVLSGLVALLVWFLFFRSTVPSEIRGHEIQGFGESGVGRHVEGQVSYETSPPVSGPHAASPLPACGVHAAPIPNEQQVHLLEHGAVGIQYQPDLDPAEIARIEALVRDYDSHVFSAPYPDMEPAIAVTSWGEKMELDDLDEAAIEEYIEVFRDRGPEANQECPTTSDQPFEPQPTAPPQPSPTPS